MRTDVCHFFSQLVYLNLPPESKGSSTVADTAYFYLHTQAGRRLLEKRFGASPREYPLWQEMLATVPQELQSWQIVDVLDDNAPRQTGFYGCAYRCPQGGRVVAFRGSEKLGNPYFKNDYITDFSLILCGKTPQQAMADHYWSRYGGARGEIWVTGHSLGGNLAAYGAMAAPHSLRPSIQGVCCFNSPGFCPEFLKQYQESAQALGDRLTLYQNRYDLISSLLEHPVKPRVIASRFDPSAEEEPTIGDVIYPHSNFMFETDEAGELVPDPGGAKSPLCHLVHQLSDLLLTLPLPVRQELITLTLDAIYSSPNGSAGRKAALEAASRYLSRHLSRSGAKYSAMVTYGAGLLQQQNPAAFLAKLHEESLLPGALAKTLVLLLHLLRP